MYRGQRERERSLKTVESGEVDLCAGGARGGYRSRQLLISAFNESTIFTLKTAWLLLNQEDLIT